MRQLTLGDRLKQANWLLLAVGVMLAFVGVFTVQAASQGKAIDYGWLQLRWTVIGVVLCLLMLAVPYRRVVEWRYLIYGVGILLLIAVLAAGSGRSAKRWIQLGSFRMQPSEIMKVVMVITLAGFIRYQKSYRRFTGLFMPFALTCIPLLLIMLQPDLGTALLLIPILFVLLFVAGAQRRHLAIVAATGVVVAVAMYFIPGVLKPYQKNRIHAYLQQHSEDRALLQKQGHHIHHSKTVVGAASLTGLGLGEETHQAVRFLPERHSDFVFPVFVAAFGLTGTTALFALYSLLILLLLRTALRVREPSGRLLAIGSRPSSAVRRSSTSA